MKRITSCSLKSHNDVFSMNSFSLFLRSIFASLQLIFSTFKAVFHMEISI